jgi:hypothetical protein
MELCAGRCGPAHDLNTVKNLKEKMMSRRIASIAAGVTMLIGVPASAMAQAVIPGSPTPLPGSSIAPAAPLAAPRNGLTVAPGFNYSDPNLGNSGFVNPGGIGSGGVQIAPGSGASGLDVDQIGPGGGLVAPGSTGLESGTNLLTSPRLNPPRR